MDKTNSKTKYSRIQLYVSPVTQDAIREVAEENRRSISAECEIAIEEHIRANDAAKKQKEEANGK